MPEFVSSLKMRAERSGRHLSGAERLLALEDVEAVAVEMLQRAFLHSRGQAERISLKVEEIPRNTIQFGQLPDLFNNQVNNWQQGRKLARQLLYSIPVKPLAVDAAMKALEQGAAPDGSSMRGAMLIDAETGERLEIDQARGVRASRMDLTMEACKQLRAALYHFGLDNQHVLEALTLAAKVIAAPGVVAELCWSDDPDYVAGYVASKTHGYQRISELKPIGEVRGGRAFFVNCEKTELPDLIDWLERQPLLIERIGKIHAPRYWKNVT